MTMRVDHALWEELDRIARMLDVKLPTAARLLVLRGIRELPLDDAEADIVLRYDLQWMNQRQKEEQYEFHSKGGDDD